MSETTEIRCEHCSEVCEDDWELQVLHRGCRFKALFPGTFEAKDDLLAFDVKKIEEQLKKGTPG